MNIQEVDKALERTEFLLRRVKRIENALIQWFKAHIYAQGDSYDCHLTKDGCWCVSYSNDYPLQHGHGTAHVFTPQEFADATEKIWAEHF